MVQTIFVIELCRINIAMVKDGKCVLLFVLYKFMLFLVLHLESNRGGCTNQTNGHVLENLLISSSKYITLRAITSVGFISLSLR